MESVDYRNSWGHKIQYLLSNNSWERLPIRKGAFFVEPDADRGALRLTTSIHENNMIRHSAFAYCIRIVAQNRPHI